MHTKYARFEGIRDGAVTVQVVEPGRKLAAESAMPTVRDFISKLAPDPKYSYVLVTAMGYSEFYGPNSNTDWYGYNPYLDFNGLLHAPPGCGMDVEADRIRSKGWLYGYPAFYDATVYAHHKNTDPQQLGFGDVILSIANPKMKRIELVLRVLNEEAIRKGHTSILDRLRAGERVDVSMGAKIPFDLCSICTDWDGVKRAWATYDPKVHAHPGIAVLLHHRRVAPIRGLAEKPDDYCSCMKTRRGKVLPDGRKVYVFNDFARFFDISFVWIGADRTARAMWFLLPDTMPVVTPSAPTTLDPKTRLLEIASRLLAKSASRKLGMTKEITGGSAELIPTRADQDGNLCAHLPAMAKSYGPKTLLSSLAALGIVLRPDEFTSVLAATDPAIAASVGKTSELKLKFNPSTGGVTDTYAVEVAKCDAGLLKSASDFLAPSRSFFAPYLEQRIWQGSAWKSLTEDLRASESTLNKLASAYNGYRLSLLEQCGPLFEKGAQALDLVPLLAQKQGSDELALLLLGLGPVVHLLASHLEERRESGSELGALGTFVADNPSFTAVSTIGAGLRAAMAIDAAGGIPAAARKLLGAIRTL